MTHPQFKDIEAALGLADATARHRASKRYDLEIGSGDPVPSWQRLCGTLAQRLIAESERPSESIQGDLRQAKLTEEINILKERYRKLEIGNQAKANDLVDVRELFAGAMEFAGFIRRAADSMGKLDRLTGGEAQEMLNGAIRDFEDSASKGGAQ